MERKIGGVECAICYVGTSGGLYRWVGICGMGEFGHGVEMDGWAGGFPGGGADFCYDVYAGDAEVAGAGWKDG